ncbi:MAG: SpoIIE family protein phosphatase [Isosphaeraceae bacterium]
MSDSDSLGPRLEIPQGGRPNRQVPLSVGVTRIGRTEGFEVRFDDTRVSRDHARIERREGGACHLVDTSRHHATFLNGKRLPESRAVPLADGDVIRIVEHEMIFRGTPTVVGDDLDGSSTVLQTVHDFDSVEISRRAPRPAVAFRAVLDVNRALGGGGDLDDVLGRALDSLMELFSQTECGLIATAEPDGLLPVRAIRRRGGPPPKLTLSRSILRRVIEQGEAVLIQDVATDKRFNKTESVAALFRSALCVPLPGHDGKPVGMVQLGGQSGHRDGFSGEDLDMLVGLAVPLGVAVQNYRLLRERANWAAAREIERVLLPGAPPEVPGYAFWQCYRPAQEVGGDLYNYVRVGPDDPRWVICVGDVAGKGMPAALVSVAVNPEVRQAVASGAPPAEVLRGVNRQICGMGLDTRFVTMILAELDPVAHRLTIASAGHEIPLLRRADGTVTRVELKGSGKPLGIVPTEDYEATTLALEPGEVLVLYSDGLPDSFDRAGKKLGLDAVERVLAAAGREVSQAGEALLQAVENHARGRTPFDDLTIICLGREADSIVT